VQQMFQGDLAAVEFPCGVNPLDLEFSGKQKTASLPAQSMIHLKSRERKVLQAR
jgi:hypothetical protein